MDSARHAWEERSEAERTRLLIASGGGLMAGAVGGLKGVALAGVGLAAAQAQQEDGLHRLDPVLLGVGAVGGVLGATLGSTGILIFLVAGGYATTTLPTNASFTPFFERWFRSEFYPQVMAKLQRELEARARNPNSSLVDFLKDTAANVVFQATSRMQEVMAWDAVATRVLPHTRFSDFRVVKTATVDLGSANAPCKYTFWGVGNKWMLAPYLKMDFENVNVLGFVQ